MSAKVKAKYEILRVSGNGYMIDDPNGCEVVYRETSRPFATRRGDEVTYLLERIDELEEANEQLETQVEELKAARNASPAKSPWRPIETAPKDGTWIFGTSYDCKASPHGAAAVLVHWIDSPLCGTGWSDECADEFGMCFYELTHYMLIPETPARPEEQP